MDPRVAKLGHLELRTPDLPTSVWFFRDVIGLKESDRTDDRVYLRGLRDREHHTLTLKAASETAVDHVAWRVSDPGDVAAVGERLDAADRTVTRIDPADERGQGEAVRVTTGTGHTYEFYHDVDTPAAPEGERSRLRNRVYGPHAANRIAPQRIDHVHVQDPDGPAHAAFFMTELDFELRETFINETGDRWGWWLSRTALPHDVAVHRKPDLEAGRVHHLCYHVDRVTDLWDAADVCREHGLSIEAGPGKHAITNADYLYLTDPGSGFRLELFAGPGYLNFEPDWEPIEWHADDIGGEDDHQWFGTQFGPDATPYAE